MRVIKKNKSIQDFDIGKIKLTLERVSDEVHKPLTQSDIQKLANSIEKAIIQHGEEYIHSSTIHEIVVIELKNAGFLSIAKAYNEYQKKF
jgi:transcriptional regulator NrdR family protein